MIVRSTVFVLGAGASKPYGFPTGVELKTLVLRELSHLNEAVFGEYEQMDCDPSSVEEFAKALYESGVGSVDSLLEHRKGLVRVGKTAIARALIPFESKDKLFVQPNDWYGHLLDKMNALPDRFHENKLTVLTFNYDRSLEWYLHKAIQERFGLNKKEVIGLMGSIPIIHLYGMLGELPWDPKNGWPYDPLLKHARIIAARDKIKIIHEDTPSDPQFERAMEALKEAQRIVLVGVGYNNRVNLQRLSPDGWHGPNLKVFGSAFGMTELEKETAARHLGGRVELGKNLKFGQTDWDALRFLREMVDFDGA